MKKLLILLLVVGLSGVASAGPTADNIEDLVEAGLGLAAGSTVALEFTNSTTGDSKDGYSIVQSASGDDWGYPDGSCGSMMMNDNCLDDKDHTASDFSFTVSGLTPGASYGIAIIAKTTASGSGKGEFGYGYASDGAASRWSGNYIDLLPGAVYIATSGVDSSWAVPIMGNIVADGSGTITAWAGAGNPFNGDEYTRTELDGIVVGAGITPEPATIMMLGLGGLALIRKRR